MFKSSLLELPPIQLNDSILCLLQFLPKFSFWRKDKLTGGTPTKDSNRCIPASITTHAPTFAIALIIAPLVASDSADSSIVTYSEDNLERIVRTIFEARPLPLPALAPVPAPVVATSLYYESVYEWLWKAQSPDIYRNKTHIECYNFFQQCKDYFATAGATELKQVLFAATFLKNTAMFCW